MSRSWFPVFHLLVLAALILAGCGPRVSQHVEESRVAVEAARAAGAPSRAPEEFQAAESTLKESQALLAAGSGASLLEADYRAAVTVAMAKSAQASARLSTDLARVQAETQAAKQEAERARAETERLQPQVRTAEEAARVAQARAERAEAQVAELKRQVTAASQPASPLTSYTRYVVKKGDTLRKIAARPEIYGDAGQWQRIYEANRDIIGRDRKLNMGQVLMIPKP
jgi:nucleoid-associated protein YgaU